MKRIGIFAYGSLIEGPGREPEALIRERILDIWTPFSVEFARSRKSRDGAPTLVPVEKEGAPVKGVILVLDPTVTVQRARDTLWRRETRNEYSSKHYSPPANPGPNTAMVECLQRIANVETVLYIRLGANIEKESRNPEHLAELAICGARREAGAKRMDGISCLISVKKQTAPIGLIHPLSVYRQPRSRA